MHVSRWLDEQTNPLLRTLDGRVQRWRVNSRISISQPNRFVFYRIPKAGHSTVGRTLAYYDPHLDEERQREVHEKGGKSSPYRHPRDAGFMTSLKAWRRFYCFTFVRNPFRRILSAHLDKIVRGKPPTKNLGPERMEGEELTFHDFLDQISGTALFHGPHWAPQVALLPANRHRLDFIGHLESIDHDLNQLVWQLFGHEMEAGVQSWDPHRTDSGSEFASYYDAVAVDTVRTLYAEDFAAFGYSDDPEAAAAI